LSAQNSANQAALAAAKAKSISDNITTNNFKWMGQWSSGPIYSINAIVGYNNSTYISLNSNNKNNRPDISPIWWELFTQGGDSSFVWMGNWASGTIYTKSNLVNYNGSSYISLLDSNVNKQPDTNPSWWGLFAQGGAGGTIHTSTGVTGDGSSGSPVALAPIAQSIVLGRHSSGTGPVENLTGAHLATIVAPASGSSPGTMAAADKTKLDTVVPNSVLADNSDTTAGVLNAKLSPARAIIPNSKVIQPPLDMVFWLKADELGLTDGTPIQVINDLSGNHNDVVQSDPTKQPIFKTGSNGINGLGVIRCSNTDGNQHVSYLTGTINTTSWVGATVYIVAKTAASSNNQFGGAFEVGVNGGSAWWNFGFGSDGTDGAGWGGHNGLVDFHAVSGYAPNTTFYGRWANDQHNWTLDGVNSGTYADLAVLTGSQPIAVGSATYPGGQFNGDIAEIIVYGRTLSGPEDAIVKSYLRHKWGLDASAVPRNIYFDLNATAEEFKFPKNVIRVSPYGNDNNNGLYVTTPVRSVSVGIQKLEALGGGTLEIEDQSWANPINGLGLLLYGTANHASTTPGGVIPTGYIFVSKPMQIIGLAGKGTAKGTQSTVCTIAPGGGATDFTGPALDLAGTFAPLNFQNILFIKQNEPGVPTCIIGYSTPPPVWDAGTNYGSIDYSVIYGGRAYQVYNHDVPTGMPPTGDPDSGLYWVPCRPSTLNTGAGARAVAYSANLVFSQCGFRRDGLHAGPALDIGSAFWIWFEHCGFVAASDGSVPLTDAAVRYAGTSAGAAYLQYFHNAQFNGGGIYCYGGGNGTIINATNEDVGNLFLAEAAPDTDNSNGTVWYIFKASGEDEGTSCVSNFTTGDVVAERCTGVHRGYVKVRDPNLVAQIGTGIADHFIYGESQFVSLLQHDGARRGYGPVATAFPNVAYQFNPAATTFTTAPDGTNTAKVSGLGNEHTMFDEGVAGQVLNDGDRVIWGCWMRFDPSSDNRGSQFGNGASATGDLTIFYG
ncbi:MAG TPA: hypothetical protein VHD33_00500, partial [Legionellaceae bacterium]|nr:hypothetical protein [Legionellaceae bacterium]